MSAFPRAPLRAFRTGLKPVLALSLAALLAACSSTKHPAGPQVFAWLAPEPPPPAAVYQAEVELEDDGLPSQAPPSTAIRQMPDDPTAPWSRNYGRSGAGAADAAAAGLPNDSWVPVTAPDAWIAREGEDGEGLPMPKSPEEAGVVLPPVSPKRAALGAGWTTCLPGQSWKCTR
jgi:hypothetical protein